MLKSLCKVEIKNDMPEAFLIYHLLHRGDKLLTQKDLKYTKNIALIFHFFPFLCNPSHI